MNRAGSDALGLFRKQPMSQNASHQEGSDKEASSEDDFTPYTLFPLSRPPPYTLFDG